ncbi:ExbD/TolR family protein [Algibacter luteus]|uniref:ExbD/TolR family protein n=1 Tax=Algibacter luteus TaxID=1178825 RepID=UPI002594A7C2|nr:biopolymer transporter ExbD [Algibacter luteus]WJJ96550.1 biopolymer transporter ExbD [Algibacter luteus]
MKTNFLLNIIIGFLLTSCVAQNERIENIIMDCSYQSFDDNGIAFRKLISDYENLLINENILADNSGKSYRQVLKDIASEKEFDKVPSKFFAEELQKIEKPNLEKAQKCQEIIVKDSAKYDMTKLKGLEQAIDNAQYSGDLQPALIAEDILKVLTEKDFELEFYKLRTFLLFSIIDTNAGISRKLPDFENDESEIDLTNALKITLDDKNQIFVNGKKVSLDDLKTLVRDYESEFKSESIISLKADRGTMYRTYIDVQNAIVGEIQHLRNKLAREKYKTELDKLTEEQQSEIKKVYPQKLIE